MEVKGWFHRPFRRSLGFHTIAAYGNFSRLSLFSMVAIVKGNDRRLQSTRSRTSLP